MDHLSAADIDTNMSYRIAGVICPRKEDDVTRLCLRCADMLALVINALRRSPLHIVVTAVSEHITDKS